MTQSMRKQPKDPVLRSLLLQRSQVRFEYEGYLAEFVAQGEKVSQLPSARYSHSGLMALAYQISRGKTFNHHYSIISTPSPSFYELEILFNHIRAGGVHHVDLDQDSCFFSVNFPTIS